jgi:hypothetical protein
VLVPPAATDTSVLVLLTVVGLKKQLIVSGSAVRGIVVVTKQLLLALVKRHIGPADAICNVGGVADGLRTRRLTRSVRNASTNGDQKTSPAASGES